MKKLIVLMLLFSLISVVTAEEIVDMSQFLPSESNENWKLEGEPGIAEGMKLFMLINGGAELYLTKGFKITILATYLDSENNPFNIDVFQMNSPTAAKETNREKIGGNGEILDFANDAYLEEYYVNFWKGSIQVTVSASNPESFNRSSLLDLARIVAERIPD